MSVGCWLLAERSQRRLAVLPVSPKGPRALPPGLEGCEPGRPRNFSLEWGHGDPVPESVAASLRPVPHSIRDPETDHSPRTAGQHSFMAGVRTGHPVDNAERRVEKCQ